MDPELLSLGWGFLAEITYTGGAGVPGNGLDPPMFSVLKSVLQSAEVQMKLKNGLSVVVVLIALVVAVAGADFEVVSLGGGLESISGLHW
jgi:hypothetical protein